MQRMAPDEGRESAPERSPWLSWRLRCATAAVVAVLVAAVVHGAATALLGASVWVPPLTWLVAGVVIGLVMERRAPAMTVAVTTTVCAGVVSAVLNAIEPVDGASPVRTALLTVTCTLASLLGAAGVVELRRRP